MVETLYAWDRFILEDWGFRGRNTGAQPVVITRQADRMTYATSRYSPGSNGQFADNLANCHSSIYEEGNTMKFNSGIAAAVALSFAVAGLAACEKEGPMEKAGKAVDNAGEKVGEKIENAGEKIQDAAKDAKK